jgi:hypothetical protein
MAPPHPAFALEGRGSWHALTLSLRQQVFGPLRFCADLRCVLCPWSALNRELVMIQAGAYISAAAWQVIRLSAGTSASRLVCR